MENLEDTLLLKIVSFLTNVIDVTNFTKTCKKFNRICSQNKLIWQHLYNELTKKGKFF